MASLSRHIHPLSNFAWKPLAELAPDVQIADDEQTGEPPMVLGFFDPDGEAHLYVFTEDGRQRLLRELTGGIIVANGNGSLLQ